MTIKELIYRLTEIIHDKDSHTDVVIMDADEGYSTLLNITEIEIGDGYVGLGGTYNDRWEPKDSMTEPKK